MDESALDTTLSEDEDKPASKRFSFDPKNIHFEQNCFCDYELDDDHFHHVIDGAMYLAQRDDAEPVGQDP